MRNRRQRGAYPGRMGRPSRTVAALLFSVVGHGGAVVALSRITVTGPQNVRVAHASTTPLVWVDVEPTQPSPRPLAGEPALVRPPRTRRAAPKMEPAPPLPGPSTNAGPVVEALPRRSLLPRDVVLGSGPLESSAGLTLHPGDAVADAEAARVEVEARVSSLVEGFALQTIRRQRVANGLVAPKLEAVRHQLARATDTVPDLIGLDDPKAIARAVTGAWQSGAERYGKTGAPYDTPEGWNPAIEQPASLMERARSGSPEMQNFVQFLTAGARLQEFADGRAGKKLIALVALTQAPDGSVLELRLSQGSGLAPFDAWVLETADRTLAAFRFDAGANDGPSRSLWQFEGRISFMRKAAGAPTARDVAATLPLVVLSALTGGRVPVALGRFDEVTGEREVLDLSSPHYECTVTLLEAD